MWKVVVSPIFTSPYKSCKRSEGSEKKVFQSHLQADLEPTPFCVQVVDKGSLTFYLESGAGTSGMLEHKQKLDA